MLPRMLPARKKVLLGPTTSYGQNHLTFARVSFLSGYGLFKAVPTKKGDLLSRECVDVLYVDTRSQRLQPSDQARSPTNSKPKTRTPGSMRYSLGGPHFCRRRVPDEDRMRTAKSGRPGSSSPGCTSCYEIRQISCEVHPCLENEDR